MKPIPLPWRSNALQLNAENNLQATSTPLLVEPSFSKHLPRCFNCCELFYQLLICGMTDRITIIMRGTDKDSWLNLLLGTDKKLLYSNNPTRIPFVVKCPWDIELKIRKFKSSVNFSANSCRIRKKLELWIGHHHLCRTINKLLLLAQSHWGARCGARIQIVQHVFEDDDIPTLAWWPEQKIWTHLTRCRVQLNVRIMLACVRLILRWISHTSEGLCKNSL